MNIRQRAHSFTSGLVVAAAVATLAGSLRAQETNAVHFVDLPTALRLAGANSLDVKLAHERQIEAEANYEAARLKFLPWLAPAIGYRYHDGNVQAVDGSILSTEKQSYTGGVGLNAQVDLGDAWYQKLSAKQLQVAAGHAAAGEHQLAVLRAAS